MNRKGFTLIELIAVIVLLGIILVLTYPSMANAFKNARLKNEEIFLDRLSETIDSYVTLNSDKINFNNTISGTKTTENNSSYTVTVYKGTIKIEDLIDDDLIVKNDFINPGNKDVTCKTTAEIEVYRDSDYVYCHKIRKDSLGCLSSEFSSLVEGNYAINSCTWK